MNSLAPIPTETLPTLIDKATHALENARTSAEVLDARDMARAAYDAAKSAGRMEKAKRAHGNIVARVHEAQAHALAIRTRAEMRLADEYDAAQERNEVAGHGGGRNFKLEANKVETTSADLGLRYDEIHEARKLRDAEKASPGIISSTISGMIERGEEPTRAALKSNIAPKPKRKIMDPRALWLWGRLKDFERDSVLDADPSFLLSEMTEPMRADVRRLLPLVREFIEDMECKS